MQEKSTKCSKMHTIIRITTRKLPSVAFKSNCRGEICGMNVTKSCRRDKKHNSKSSWPSKDASATSNKQDGDAGTQTDCETDDLLICKLKVQAFGSYSIKKSYL